MRCRLVPALGDQIVVTSALCNAWLAYHSERGYADALGHLHFARY